MLIMSLGCLQFSREPCLLYTFLLGYLPSIFCDFGEKPIDFYLQDSFFNKTAYLKKVSGYILIMRAWDIFLSLPPP